MTEQKVVKVGQKVAEVDSLSKVTREDMMDSEYAMNFAEKKFKKEKTWREMIKGK